MMHLREQLFSRSVSGVAKLEEYFAQMDKDQRGELHPKGKMEGIGLVVVGGPIDV